MVEIQRDNEAPSLPDQEERAVGDSYQRVLDYNQGLDKNIEQQVAAQQATAEGDNPNGGYDAGRPDNSKSGLERAQEGITKAAKKIFRGGSKAKWAAFGGAGVIIGSVMAIAVLFFLADFLKIPNLAQDITGIEFARAIRQFEKSVYRTSNLAAAIQTAGDEVPKGQSKTLRQLLQDEYTGEKPLLSKLQSIYADKVADNLGANGGNNLADQIKFNYDASGQVLQSIERDGKILTVPRPTALDRLIPGWRLFTKGIQDAKFNAELQDMLKLGIGGSESRGLGTIARGLTARTIRRQLGIGLVEWTVATLKNKFKGKSNAQADAGQTQNDFNEVSGDLKTVGNNELLPGEKETEEALIEETKKEVADPNIAATPENIPKNVGKLATQRLQESLFQKIAKFGDPAYAIALSACTIYEGSLEKADGKINANDANQMKIFQTLATASDQQKAGDVNAEAIGAKNRQTGDVAKSIPYMKASNQTISPTETISGQVGPLLEYTLINAFLDSHIPNPEINAAISSIINNKVDQVCPALLSPISVVGVILAQIALFVISFGTSAGATAATDVAAEGVSRGIVEIVVDAITETISKIGTNFAAEGIWGRFGSYLASELPKAGLILGATELATILTKIVVYQNAALFFSGLERNVDYDNAAGSGGNIQAQEVQRQNGGRPMTCAELLPSSQADKTFIAHVNQSQSFTDRYFAVSNPNSLLMRSANAVYASFGGSLTKPIASRFNLFSLPASTFSSIVGMFSGLANAAGPCAPQYYGNVQFGWTEAEENLIDSDDSYLALDNQQILDQSGKEKAIADTYAYCFGYNYNSNGNGSFDPNDQSGDLVSDIMGQDAAEGKDGSMGGILSSGAIVRTDDGDIIPDQGNCSPQNLGIHNPAYGDLVFRFRLAIRYDITASQLNNLQTVTN